MPCGARGRHGGRASRSALWVEGSGAAASSSSSRPEPGLFSPNFELSWTDGTRRPDDAGGGRGGPGELLPGKHSLSELLANFWFYVQLCSRLLPDKRFQQFIVVKKVDFTFKHGCKVRFSA